MSDDDNLIPLASALEDVTENKLRRVIAKKIKNAIQDEHPTNNIIFNKSDNLPYTLMTPNLTDELVKSGYLVVRTTNSSIYDWELICGSLNKAYYINLLESQAKELSRKENDKEKTDM